MNESQLTAVSAAYLYTLGIELSASDHPLRVVLGTLIKENSSEFGRLVVTQLQRVLGENWEQKMEELING